MHPINNRRCIDDRHPANLESVEGSGLLEKAFAQYARRWHEESIVKVFNHFLRTSAPIFERSYQTGHFTASAWVISADGRRVLLTHHRKLNLWIQLGGHADGDTCLSRVAQREAEEESGLHGLIVDSEVFDLDRHRIPARGNEPEHWHYDVCYVARCTVSEAYTVSDESHALAWRDVAELVGDLGMEPSLRRMAGKWLVLNGTSPASRATAYSAPNQLQLGLSRAGQSV